MKNIVVCLDGTGNRIRVRTSTNVVKLFDLLDKRQRDAQVAFYEPGVGTFSSARAWTPLGRAISRGLGLAFGVGMLADIEEVYRYLMNTYEPGDRIFLFGFSRGAYCACAVVGLLHYVGLLRQKSDNLVRYAVSQYTGGGRFDPDRVAEARMFADIMTYGHGESGSVPVTFLGLWDTVHAPGAFRRRRTSWPYTRGLPNVLDGRHALSIDETRRPYRAHPISSTKISQVWFAGVHSDIGGGYADEPALSDITLKWMVDAAMKRGLLVSAGKYYRFRVSLDHAYAKRHRPHWLWSTTGHRRRILPGSALVHASVRARATKEPRYHHLLPSGAMFVDEHWADNGN